MGGPRVQFVWVGYSNALDALSNPDSVFHTNSNGVNVLLARLNDLIRMASRGNEFTEDIAETGRRLDAAAQSLAERICHSCAGCCVPLIVFLLPHALEEHDDPMLQKHHKNAEDLLWRHISGLPTVHPVRSEQLMLGNRWINASHYCRFLDLVAHTPYSPLVFSSIAGKIVRELIRARAPCRKVIVLDCDGTLWDGAVGELSPFGVGLSAPFIAAQKFYVELQRRGYLLCLCSKNLESDVRAVFEFRRAEMPLRLDEHIAGLRINWSPKSENIIALANDMCLGLDSFIFVDDSVCECADVQASCPGVAVLHIPSSADAIPSFLENAWCFDLPLSCGGSVVRTHEDSTRTLLYRELLIRRRAQATDDAFLASLNLWVDIRTVEATTVERAAQLTHRTNQHNTHKVVLSAAQLSALTERHVHVLTVESGDRFGHHGVVGLVAFRDLSSQSTTCLLEPCTRTCIDTDWSKDLAIVTKPPQGGHLHLLAWLLSCRALHLGIEYHMLRHAASIAAEQGAAWLAFDWVRAERNEPAAAFLFSLEGACFLPCRIDSICPSETVNNSERGLPRDCMISVSTNNDSSSTETGLEVECALIALLNQLIAEKRALRLLDLPSEHAMSLLPQGARRELCKRLLPLAGRLPALDGDQHSALSLLRGRVAGEECRKLARGRVCKSEDCPFRHSTSAAITNQDASSDRQFGILSLYPKRCRPPSGVIFVPVLSAIEANVSIGGFVADRETTCLHPRRHTLDEATENSRLAYVTSVGVALHNETYNYLARTLGSDGCKALHEWVVSQEKFVPTFGLYTDVWQKMCSEESRGLMGPEATREHAKLRREIRHAQHVMIQESNPNSYYRDVVHQIG